MPHYRGHRVKILDTDNPPIDEGDEGTSYAFREGRKIRADHPAVLHCAGAFRPIDPTDAVIYADVPALQAGAGHSDMSTTQRYIDLAGVSFRAEAELPRPACSASRSG